MRLNNPYALRRFVAVRVCSENRYPIAIVVIVKVVVSGYLSAARKRFSAALVCLAKGRHMSFLSVSRLPFASPETLPQLSGHSLALPSAVTCPFLAFRDYRLPARKLSRRPTNASRQLWPHATFLDTALPCKALWPCLAKRRHMSLPRSVHLSLYTTPK